MPEKHCVCVQNSKNEKQTNIEGDKDTIATDYLNRWNIYCVYFVLKPLYSLM